MSAARPDDCNVFLSYGRRDTGDLPHRLAEALASQFGRIWFDRLEIEAGRDWRDEIAHGLRQARVVVAIMTPHSVRRAIDAEDESDSTCLNEIGFAVQNRIPVVPVMAMRCEPPFALAHLDFIDLVGWEQSPGILQMGLDRLIDAIHAALRGERRYRSWYSELKPWDFENYLAEKRRYFSGRQWLFEEIEQWLKTRREERALLIRGDPGVGKSAVAAQLVFDNPDGRMLAYHCCQADTQETLNPARMVRSFAAMIASRLAAYAERLERRIRLRGLGSSLCGRRNTYCGNFGCM
jgi:hypothetical protein